MPITIRKKSLTKPSPLDLLEDITLKSWETPTTTSNQDRQFPIKRVLRENLVKTDWWTMTLN